MSVFQRGFALLLAVAVMGLLPAAAHAKWLRAESPRFIVYSDGSESALRGYVTQMEVFDSLLRSRHGLPENGVPPRKLPIYLVRDRADLQRTWNGASDSVAGYYMPGPANTFAVAVLEGEDKFVTLRHEYVHHFMLQNFPGAYPAWMIEGYAEYYSMTSIDDKYVEVGRVNNWRSYDLNNGKWLPMADLLANKRGVGGREWSDFYAESWLLTHYLMSTPERFAQFQAYANAVGKGADPVTAMETATGMPTTALDQVLKKYKAGALVYTQYKRTNFTEPQITVTTLPPSADALLLEHLELVGHSYTDARPGYLAMIQQRAARFPGDQLAALALGRAELELGDKARGRALLDAWIKDHPDDVEARFVLGDNLLWQASDALEKDKDQAKASALMAEAEGYLAPAAQRAPNDYRVLYAYARSRRQEPGFPSVETRDILIRAYKQAPQVTGLRFELIQVLMARKHWREAEALLKPLVNSPHGGEVVEKARELMKRVQAAQAAAAG